MNIIRTIALMLILTTAIPAYALQINAGGQGTVGADVPETLDVSADVSANASATGTMKSHTETDSASTAGAQVGPLVVTRASVVASDNANVASPSAVSTDADLAAYANTVVKNDENMDSTSLSSQEIALGYKERAHLFGFIPILMSVTAKVAADGSVSLQYPWYAFLTANDDATLRSSVEAAVSPTLGASTSAGFSVSQQAQVLAELHSAMKSSLDATLAAEAQASTSTH